MIKYLLFFGVLFGIGICAYFGWHLTHPWKIFWIKHNNIVLWTESLGDPRNSACLLISGAGAPAKFWTNEFCRMLVDAGYYVIRFDHRDQGLSSAVDFEQHPYTVLDLTEDVIAILDGYRIKKAHIIGHSMGGMIAQLLAIYHPDRVLSMTSMSVGTVSELGMPPQEVMDVLLENKPTQNFEESFPGFMRSWRVLNGTFAVNEAMASAYTKDFYDRSKHPVEVAWNHIKAQEGFHALGSQLATIKVPALFIHGELDPLIPVSAGMATAQAVSHAKTEIIPGMGHMMFDRSLEQAIARILIDFFLKDTPK